MKKFQKIAKKVVNVNNVLVKASLGNSATEAEVLQLNRKELVQNLKYNKEVFI